MRIERNGRAFYESAAKRMPRQDSAAVLLDLAKMEAEHEEVFAAMQKALESHAYQKTSYTPHDEAYEFLRATADKSVFDPQRGPGDVLGSGSDPAAILNVAIELEKDTVAFYEAIKPLIPEELRGEKIEAIIAQEVGHIMALTEQLAQIETG